MTAEHTPTPYKVHTWGTETQAVFEVLDAHGYTLATLEEKEEDHAEPQHKCPNLKTVAANANFIVRACNSHKALVEACQNVLDGMEKPAVLNQGEWQTGLFCGLEDQGITDRYDACLYGYEKAIERVREWATDGYITEALAKAKGENHDS
jgi:hypothetical protein